MLVQDLGNLSNQVGAKVPIVAFLTDDADPRGMITAIQDLPDVDKVDLIPKDQAWQEMQEDLKTKMTFNNLLDNNPLPNSLRIQVKDPAGTEDLAHRIEKMQGVEQVNYGGDLLKKISEFTTFIRTGGLGISGLLALASLAVIMNTIRLAVMARRREIEIMHLVGASNSFIAWPFLLEGMLFGFFGALLTGGILFAWRYFTFGKWQELFPFLPLTIDYFSVVQVLGILAVLGMGLGALGSLLSVHKHIRLAMAD
jgi:cell division transport system permease protein